MRREIHNEKSILRDYFDMHNHYNKIAHEHGCDDWLQMGNLKHPYPPVEQYERDVEHAQKVIEESIADYTTYMLKDLKDTGELNALLGVDQDWDISYAVADKRVRNTIKLKYYYNEPVCEHCGKPLSWHSWEDDTVKIHYVDGNEDNFTLTNMMILCDECKKKYERKSQYKCSVTKSFVFDACHFLPYHDRRCKFLHGHTYHMDITVKNAVLQETGMVIDFGKLKKVVEEEVLDDFDHGFLNEFIEYPTCEVMIAWVWYKLSIHIKGLQSIKIWETDGSYCELTNKDMEDYLNNFECDWRE